MILILIFFLVSISVQEGIIRHFDHITDLPSSPWYRVPQKGEDYKTFQDLEYTNAKLTVLDFPPTVCLSDLEIVKTN